MRACNGDEATNHETSDPWDIFTQLAILIIEGRTPGGAKGYHAGPHCLLPHQVGGNRHVCDPNSTMCVKIEPYLRQLRLMWGVGVGVTVEVLVAPECKHGSAFTTTTQETTTAPSPLLTLIEQWNFTVYDRYIPDVTTTGRSLVAAVRSFLHFSQLSAWLSVSGGSRPPNVLHRLIVTSPEFCSKFESGSEGHTFPITNLGQETGIKVMVRSLPRCSKVPIARCPECHKDQSSASSKVVRAEASPPSSSFPVVPLATSCEAFDRQYAALGKSETNKTEEDLRRSIMKARLGGDPSRSSRSESPDTQLGESLLDPPHSLSRIPRRFQSPSRSGSPSFETPEHVMCRVRTPGPSHGRPPDMPGTFYPQPLLQPLNPFALAHQPLPYPHLIHYPFTPVSNEPVPFDQPMTPQYFWPPQMSAASKAFAPLSPPPSVYRHRHDSDHGFDHLPPTTPFYPSLTPFRAPFYHSSIEAGQPLMDQMTTTPRPPSTSFYSVPTTTASSSQATSCPLHINVDIDEAALLSGSDCGSPRSADNQGTKRKGAYAKESPRTKRESPPHVYYSKEGKGKADFDEDNLHSGESSENEDFLKRKNQEDHLISAKKNSQNKKEIVSDQLWPSCSQPGKHICSSHEDISEISKQAIQKSVKKVMGLETDRKTSPPCSKVNFDLTPKETQEILSLLRQNTPLPPLRIGQHRNSSAESRLNSSPKEIKLRRISEDLDYRSKLKAECDFTWCHKTEIAKKSSGIPSQKDATSSNQPCDTNFKTKCLCRPKGKSDPDDDDDDGVIEDGLCSEEIAKLLKDPNCIQARMITHKTCFFTAKSEPGVKETQRQISKALLKSPLSSVLSSIKNVSLKSTPEFESENVCTARRVLRFDDWQVNKDQNSSSKLLCPVQKSGGEIREDGSKQVSVLRQLTNKTVAAPSSSSPPETFEKEKPVEEEAIVSNGHNAHVDVDEEEEPKDESNEDDNEVAEVTRNNKGIPSTIDKAKFRRSLDSAATLVFHNKTGLPLTSSPAPLRSRGNCFDFDSSLNSVAAIRCAFRTCEDVDEEENDNWVRDSRIIRPSIRSVLSASAPATLTCSNLLGSFEECVLNGRLEPVSTVHGFSAEIAASGAFCPKHTFKPVTVFFYTLCDNDQISSPYMGHINLGKKGYHVPNKGTVQVTLFNPHGTVVKMFVVMYDISDMPPNSKTFLRQRTLNMPVGETDKHPDAHQWLRYLIHLRFASSKSGKIYLHTDIRILIFHKSDADAANLHQTSIPYELRSFTNGPINPKFSPRK